MGNISAPSFMQRLPAGGDRFDEVYVFMRNFKGKHTTSLTYEGRSNQWLSLTGRGERTKSLCYNKLAETAGKILYIFTKALAHLKNLQVFTI